MRIIAVLFQVVCVAAFAALPEGWTTERTLGTDYQDKITPFWDASEAGSFFGKDHAFLYYKAFEVPAEKGAIVFVTGWTETARKYQELIYTFTRQGYSVYAMDNRGQGYSSRLAKNNQIVHVEHYQDYVTDLKQFVDKVVRARAHRKIFFMTHSMGGLVAALYATQYPWDVDGIIASSPLFQVETGKVPETVAYGIARTSAATGWAKSYILTHHDTTPESESDFMKQTATHSPGRWDKKVELWKKYPVSFMSGSSNRWLQRTIEATWWLRRGGAKFVRAPMLMFQAGLDTRVTPAGQDKVCKLAPKCTEVKLPASYHEMLIEKDSIRNRVMARIFEFLEANR